MFADFLERFAKSFEVPKISAFQGSKELSFNLSKTKTSEVSK